MFPFFRKDKTARQTATPAPRRPTIEGLERRTFLSAAVPTVAAESTDAAAVVASVTTTTAATTKIAYSETPAVVQTGLAALAQGVTISATHIVRTQTLRDGAVTYTTAISVNGKQTRIAVDADGNPIAGKVAFGDAPSVVQTALQAQVSGISLSDEQIVAIRSRGSVVVYSTAVSVAGKTTVVASDAEGTAVTKKGRELIGGTTVTFAEAPAAVQTGLAALAQGSTIGDDQEVDVLTLPDDTTVYSALLSIDGEPARVMVDADGSALEGWIAFADAPAAVQTALQAQATDGTIADTQLVQIHTRPGGTSTYATSVELADDATVIAFDADGTGVTTGPWGGRGPGGGDAGGDVDGPSPDGGHGGGGPHGGPAADDATRTSVTFAEAPDAVKIGLQKLTLGTLIADTQQIDVKTLTDGTTSYSAVLTIDSQPTRIAVTADGVAIEGLLAFADTPAVVQTGLQSLATGGTIPADQVIRLNTRPTAADTTSPTTVYSTTVTIDGVSTRIAVDATGATVESAGPGAGPGGGDRHGPHGPGAPGDSGFGGGADSGTAGMTDDTAATKTTGKTLTAGPASWFGGSLGGVTVTGLSVL